MIIMQLKLYEIWQIIANMGGHPPFLCYTNPLRCTKLHIYSTLGEITKHNAICTVL